VTKAIILASPKLSMTGMQPIDQSKHNHQGFTSSQAFIEYK
jgi:hypothetical protein